MCWVPGSGQLPGCLCPCTAAVAGERRGLGYRQPLQTPHAPAQALQPWNRLPTGLPTGLPARLLLQRAGSFSYSPTAPTLVMPSPKSSPCLSPPSPLGALGQGYTSSGGGVGGSSGLLQVPRLAGVLTHKLALAPAAPPGSPDRHPRDNSFASAASFTSLSSLQGASPRAGSGLALGQGFGSPRPVPASHFAVAAAAQRAQQGTPRSSPSASAPTAGELAGQEGWFEIDVQGGEGACIPAVGGPGKASPTSTPGTKLAPEGQAATKISIRVDAAPLHAGTPTSSPVAGAAAGGGGRLPGAAADGSAPEGSGLISAGRLPAGGASQVAGAGESAAVPNRCVGLGGRLADVWSRMQQHLQP